MNKGPRAIPTSLTLAEKAKVNSLIRELGITNPSSKDSLRQLASLCSSWHPEADTQALTADYLASDEYADEVIRWNKMKLDAQQRKPQPHPDDPADAKRMTRLLRKKMMLGIKQAQKRRKPIQP